MPREAGYAKFPLIVAAPDSCNARRRAILRG
jgi:hypothetical protein